MAVEDIEKRVRAMTGKKDIPDDKQQAAFQSAQNELVRINSERQNNLALANAEANADAQVNETLLQAGEMASMGSPAVQQQVESMNPQTQAVLSKYGLGKPRVQRTQGREVKVTPQKVQITNNNITNTTNNVAVPPANIGGPVQGRTLAIKQEDPGQARFKTWIQSAFAKQNAKAAQREKEYQRREWSLSRSANKMMKYLSDLGSNISEKLNPNKMAATVGGQFKTILFLFGTMFLAKHWKKVIEIGASIEKFFLGAKGEAADGKGRGRSGFAKMLISVFGGDPNGKDGILDSLGKFFWNPSGNGGKGVFDLLLLKIKMFFQEGAEAVKKLELPKIDLDKPLNSLGDLFKYLGNVISCLFTGSEGLKSAISGELKSKGAKSQTGEDESGDKLSWVNGKDESIWTSKKFDKKLGADELKQIGRVGLGEAGVNYGDFASERNNINYLKGIDTDSNGNLTGTVGSTLRQSSAISSMITDKNSINTVGVLTGLRNIEKAVLDNKAKYGNTAMGVAVEDKSFFTNLGLSEEDIKDLIKSGDIKTQKFKYVVDKKTPDELKRELEINGGDPVLAGANGAARGMINSAIGKHSLIGTIVGIAGGAALCFLPGGQIAAVPIITSALTGGTAGYLLGKAYDDPKVQGALDFSKAVIKSKDTAEWVIRMVPATDKRPGLYFNEEDGTLSDKPLTGRRRRTASNQIVEKYTVTENALNKIKEKLGLRQFDKNGNLTKNLPFDETNTLSLDSTKSFLENSHLIRSGKLPKNNDYDLSKLSSIREIDELHQQNSIKFNNELRESRMYKGFNNVSEGIGSAVNWLTHKFNADKLTGYKHISEKESKENTKKVVDFFTAKGYTPEQASGIAGVLHYESGGMNPASENLAEKAKGWKTKGGFGNFGRGLAQWSNERIDNFANWHKSKYGESLPPNEVSIDKQLEFIWREMQSRPGLLKALKDSTTTNEAVDAWVRGYENGGSDLANVYSINSTYAKHGNSWEKMMETRVPRAEGILQEFFKNRDSNDSNMDSNSESISPDSSGIYTAQNINTPTNYVERLPSSGSSDYTAYNWNSPNSSLFGSNELEMATKNITTSVSPSSISPTSSLYNYDVENSSTPSIATAKELVANNDMTEIAKGISGKISTLNENIKVLQTGQLAQAESINNLSAAIGNIQINVNAGGQQKSPVQSATGVPYQAKWG